MKTISSFILAIFFWGNTASSQTCDALFSADASNVSVQFTDLSTSLPDDPIVSWLWDFDLLGSSIQQNPLFTFPEARKYDITLSVTTQSGCTSTVEIRIEICAININYSVGLCDETGMLPVTMTISDIYDNAEEVSITIDGQPIDGSPFMIDTDNPLQTTTSIPGDGLEHIVSVLSNDAINCTKEITITTEDCNSDCFLSALDINYVQGIVHSVNIGDNFFSPQSLAIDLGDIVRFNWVGNGHSTTSDNTSGPDSWNSGVIGTGSTFDVDIVNPGVHKYYCIPHGGPGGVGMSGEILSNCPQGTSLDLELSFVTSVANAQGYEIRVDGQIIQGSPFSYTGTGIQSQFVNIPGDNINHIIEVIDLADPSCIIVTDYQAPDCNQGGGNPVCNLSLTSSNITTCDNNGNVNADLLVTWANTSSSFNLNIGDGPPTNYLYDGNPTAITVQLTGDGSTYNVQVTDAMDLSCTSTTSIISPDCSLPCSISNFSATPPSNDGTASGIIHTVNVEDFQFTPNTIDISAGDQVEWIWTGEIAHTSTSDATAGNDSWNSDLLSTGASFLSPVLSLGSHPYYCIPHGAPGGVGMSGVINVLPACNNDNTVNVNVDFTIDNPGTSGFYILIDNVSSGPFIYEKGRIQNRIIAVSGDGQNHIIGVMDVDDNTCTSTTMVTTPACVAPPDPCILGLNRLTSGSCKNGGLVPIDVPVSITNGGTSFTLNVDGNTFGNFSYGSSGDTTITIEITGDGLEHIIEIVDNTIPSCTASATIALPDCNLPCSILNLTAKPSSSDGLPSGIIHRVNVEDFQFNPLSITIAAGDQVEWAWTGAIDHTSTSDATSGADSWDSGLLGTGSTFLSPVLNEGIHPYYCIPHGAPGGIGMSGIINVVPSCYQDGTVDVQVAFEAQNPGQSGYEVIIDGILNTINAYIPGTLQSLIINVPGDGSVHSVEITDVEDPVCSSSTTFITPVCSNAGCQVSMSINVEGGCNEGTVSLQLSIDGDQANTEFEIVKEDLVIAEIVTNADGQANTSFEILGDGMSNLFIARSKSNPECSDSLSIDIPGCDNNCIIQNLELLTKASVEIVEVQDFEFFPKNIQILLGDTVRFQWKGEIPHTVTSDTLQGEDVFDSGLWGQGHTYDLIINNSGNHPYYCIPHGGPGGIGMSGVITVIDTCFNETVNRRLVFAVDGGSPLGFNWFLDGEIQSLQPIDYTDRNGHNEVILPLPSDGNSHNVTVQDLETEFCAHTATITTPICDTTCLFSDLTAHTGSDIIHIIEVRDFEFFPKDITVNVGETIRYVWTGEIPHTTTSDALTGNDVWSSELLGLGSSYDLIINESGDHPYYCIPHGGPGGIGMAGSITAFPNCSEGKSALKYGFDVKNGSLKGYKIFIDGQLQTPTPVLYSDKNGFNTNSIDVAGDGMPHVLTIQDVETEFCAFSASYNSLQCVDNCMITGLAYKPSPPSKDTVLVKDFEFVPRDIGIESGDTLVFQWIGDIPHTVTSDFTSGETVFNSGLLGLGGSYELVINETGEHAYYCIPHGGPGGIGMSGTITVLGQCEDGVLNYNFNFYRNSSSPGYSVLVNGATIISNEPYLPGSFQEFSLSLDGDNSELIIEVMDNGDDNCREEITIPGFDCNDPCFGLLGAFIYDIDYNNLSVDFLDQSTGSPVNWNWDFGNGNNGSGPDISTSFDSSGTYEVCLSVAYANGCSDVYCDKINFDKKTCDISFVYEQEGLELTFINTSTLSEGDYDVVWNFDDGSSSTEKDSVSHTFVSGVYEVCLLNTSSSCNDVFCQIIDLSNPCLLFKAGLAYDVDQDDDLSINFTDLSSSTATTWLWGFGDGITTTDQNPSHTYAKSGTYSICLLAQDTITPCSNAYCQSIVVGSSSTKEESFPAHRINIFPNPSSSQRSRVFVSGYLEEDIGKNSKLMISDVTGRIINRQQSSIKKIQEVNIQNFQRGIYFMQIYTDDKLYMGKFIVQ